MKRMLMRPAAAFFPAALLVSGLVGNRIVVSRLFLMYCMIQLFSLCSVDSFRNAAAREPGVRRVDRRFSGAWPMLAFGIAAAAVICMVWGKKAADLPVLIAAGMIVIEQLFEERMYAIGKNMDGVMLSAISNVLLAVGLILDGGGLSAPAEGFYAACGAGLGTVISVAASYIIEPMHAFSLMPRNIAFFPKAAVQSLLYPVIMIALIWLATWLDDSFVENMIETVGTPEFMFGFMLWRLSRTVCRRAQDESRPLNLFLVSICAVFAIAAVWIPNLSAFFGVSWVALLSTVIVFCAPSWRLYVGTVLLWAVMYFSAPVDEVRMFPVIVCAIIAIILNLHKAFLKKV